MLKSRLRITSCFLWVSLTLLGFYSPSPASAETYIATEQNRDFYFVTQEPMTMTIRTYAQEYGIDSMLWVYDGETIITTNDDYYGLDSFVSFEMIPGVNYRLRAGVCCWDPNRWYNTSYVIEPSLVPINAPTTTLLELPTTTIQSTTTTEEPTTTSTSTSTSTSSSTTSTTVETTTTTTSVVQTPFELPTTSEVPTTTTTSSTTTTTSSTTTTVPVTTAPPVLPMVLSTTTAPLAPETTATLLIPSTTTIPVAEMVSKDLSPTEAALIVTSAEILQKLTPEQAIEVFDAVEVSELSDQQAEALVNAVQDAPEEVRASFESEINIFGGKFNKYVPLGSTINVGQRKVLVAASGVLFMAPTVSVSSSTSGSQSDSRKRR